MIIEKDTFNLSSNFLRLSSKKESDNIPLSSAIQVYGDCSMLRARNFIDAFRTLLDLSFNLPITNEMIVDWSLIGIHVDPGDLNLIL